MRKYRGRPRCQLCGKGVYGPRERYDNGWRHPECVPGKNGMRYGIVKVAKETTHGSK